MAQVTLGKYHFMYKYCYSLAIVYISFGLFNWFAPIVVMYLGEKYSMIAGSFCYA